MWDVEGGGGPVFEAERFGTVSCEVLRAGNGLAFTIR